MTNLINQNSTSKYAPMPVVQKASMANSAPKQDEAAIKARIEAAYPIMDEILAEDTAVE